MQKLLKYLIAGVMVAVLVFAAYFSFASVNLNEQLVQGLIAPIEVPSDEPQLGVVLGAGLRPGSRLTDIAKERVDYAVTLHEPTGLPLVFSGGDTPYGVEADAMNEYAREQGYEGPNHIEGSSRSTLENASFTDELLDAADETIDSERLLVITSPYHSRRALATFRTVMPEREIVVTYPETSVIMENSFVGRWKGLRMIAREYAAMYWYKHFQNIENWN